MPMAGTHLTDPGVLRGEVSFELMNTMSYDAVALSGAIRRDIPAGPVTAAMLLDAYPFIDDIITVRLSGARIINALEHGLSLERGIMQVSGMTVRYDPARPVGARVLEVRVGEDLLRQDATYTVAAGSFLVNGGDKYAAFMDAEVVAVGRAFPQALVDYFRTRDRVAVPARGRLLPVAAGGRD